MHSHAGALVVIHKSGQAGKSVISAGMPKSWPWTVISRLFKCLIQETCQAVVSLPWIQGHLLCPRVCHPWTLDFGIHAEMTGFDLLVYNGESSRLVMGFLKLLLPEEGPSRSLGTSQQGGVTDNTVDIGFARRSGRDCRNPEAMEGDLHSPPCVLDTGNPCRYDGCVNSIGRYRIRATTSIKTYSVFYIY